MVSSQMVGSVQEVLTPVQIHAQKSVVTVYISILIKDKSVTMVMSTIMMVAAHHVNSKTVSTSTLMEMTLMKPKYLTNYAMALITVT